MAEDKRISELNQVNDPSELEFGNIIVEIVDLSEAAAEDRNKQIGWELLGQFNPAIAGLIFTEFIDVNQMNEEMLVGICDPAAAQDYLRAKHTTIGNFLNSYLVLKAITDKDAVAEGFFNDGMEIGLWDDTEAIEANKAKKTTIAALKTEMGGGGGGSSTPYKIRGPLQTWDCVETDELANEKPYSHDDHDMHFTVYYGLGANIQGSSQSYLTDPAQQQPIPWEWFTFVEVLDSVTTDPGWYNAGGNEWRYDYTFAADPNIPFTDMLANYDFLILDDGNPNTEVNAVDREFTGFKISVVLDPGPEQPGPYNIEMGITRNQSCIELLTDVVQPIIRLYAEDYVASVHAANPVNFRINTISDPIDYFAASEYVDIDCGHPAGVPGTLPINIYCLDTVTGNWNYLQTFAVIQDLNSLCGGGVP